MRALPVPALSAVILSVFAASPLLAPPAAAESARIDSREAFVALVRDRTLTRFGVSLTVSPDGAISGRAFGQPVKGAWKWQGGYFCRTLSFGAETLGNNCQVVEKRGQTLRFTADQGKGDYADLRLR